MNDGRSGTTKLDKEKEQKKEIRLQKERDEDPCFKERGGFERDCAKSWVS